MAKKDLKRIRELIDETLENCDLKQRMKCIDNLLVVEHLEDKQETEDRDYELKKREVEAIEEKNRLEAEAARERNRIEKRKAICEVATKVAMATLFVGGSMIVVYYDQMTPRFKDGFNILTKMIKF